MVLNNTWKMIHFIILVSAFLITPNNLLKTTTGLEIVEGYTFTDYEQIEKTPKTSTDKLQNYNQTVSWENSQIILNKTMSFNVSTRLLINNTTVEFVPENTSSHITLSIESESQLEIYNSKLFLNTTLTNGKGFIRFQGGSVIISNSTFTCLGLNSENPTLFARNSQISIFNSTFNSGYAGFHFEDSTDIKISSCVFQNITQYACRGRDSSDILISKCTIKNMDKFGLILQNCIQISVNNSSFSQCSETCLQIYGGYYFDTYDIWIEENTFKDSGFGLWILGKNVTIGNNSFLNLRNSGSYVGGRNYLIKDNFFSELAIGISTPSFSATPHINETGYQWCETSISNITIKNNFLSNLYQYGIWLNNFEFETLFRIDNNSISNIGSSALAFTGNLGGKSSTNRSWVTNNLIINSTGYGILGSFTVAAPFGPSYRAHFQYTSFVKNALINCSLGYTSFESNNYFLDDIRWDDGLFGNYWDNFNGSDEEKNQIGDSFYVISAEHRQVDHAPLLSLYIIDQQTEIGSTHPVDLVRTRAELRANNTFSWIILADDDTDISVLMDGLPYTFEEVGFNVTVSFEALKVGKHNFTLIIQSGSQTYRDLVWVEIFADESSGLTDVLLLIGILGFGVAIIVVIVIEFIKRK